MNSAGAGSVLWYCTESFTHSTTSLEYILLSTILANPRLLSALKWSSLCRVCITLFNVQIAATDPLPVHFSYSSLTLVSTSALFLAAETYVALTLTQILLSDP